MELTNIRRCSDPVEAVSANWDGLLSFVKDTLSQEMLWLDSGLNEDGLAAMGLGVSGIQVTVELLSKLRDDVVDTLSNSDKLKISPS